MREIDQSDIDHWHRHGYVLIEEFLAPEELKAALENLYQYLPSWQEYSERAPLFRNMQGSSGLSAPGWVRYEFPYVGDALNQVALHRFLVGFVERLVGHTNLLMSHGAIVGKYAGRADYDQELHEDYTNNTLAFPSSGTTMVDVPMIVYYTDVTEDLGPTYIVSKEHTRHLGPTGARFYSRADHPELYEHEIPATLPCWLGAYLLDARRPSRVGDAGQRRPPSFAVRSVPHGRVPVARFSHLPRSGRPARDAPPCNSCHAPPTPAIRFSPARRPVLGPRDPCGCRGAVPRDGHEPVQGRWQIVLIRPMGTPQTQSVGCPWPNCLH